MKYLLTASIAALALATALTSCENDNINPYDYAQSNASASNTIVWEHDTTLVTSFKVPKGSSLYIMPGVTVTIAAESQEEDLHPIEIVALGNIYTLGTAEKPVVIKSDKGNAEDWGGIICGYDCQEAFFSNTEIRDAGATPTESSMSYMNQLFKTTIDGGVPAFHFCNTYGKFAMIDCFLHNNRNDQVYFTGGNGIITGCVFANSGNAADGGEAINFKSGCTADIAYNVVYDASTNAFKLSDSGVEKNFASSLSVFNNTVVDCGWHRAKNKKGGNVWLEKGIAPVLVNNLLVDNRYGIRQPDKDGGDIANSTLAPNMLVASTDEGVKQMTKGYKMTVWDEGNAAFTSTSPESLSNYFVNFKQNDKMNINCESDDISQGAPLTWDATWDFHLVPGSKALTGGSSKDIRNFKHGLGFAGVKEYTEQLGISYIVTAPAPSTYFGAYSTK